jgi:hypothetical protein
VQSLNLSEKRREYAEKRVVEGECAFGEATKDEESFTVVHGCDGLQADRPLRREQESTNER